MNNEPRNEAPPPAKSPKSDWEAISADLAEKQVTYQKRVHELEQAVLKLRIEKTVLLEALRPAK